MKLTVIIRDPSPLIFCGDSVSFRRVTVDLTQEQEDMLKLKLVGMSGNNDIHEEYSTTFIEVEKP